MYFILDMRINSEDVFWAFHEAPASPKMRTAKGFTHSQFCGHSLDIAQVIAEVRSWLARQPRSFLICFNYLFAPPPATKKRAAPGKKRGLARAQFRGPENGHQFRATHVNIILAEPIFRPPIPDRNARAILQFLKMMAISSLAGARWKGQLSHL